jgi:hypothetical protein
MAIITRPAQNGSHWYKADGQPAHEVPSANGDGNRPTTLRDARKLHLFPSVTNVLGVLAKDALTNWKINQAVLASLKHPIQPNEAEDTYCKRVASLSMEQVFEAADLGKKIHYAIENFIKTGEEPEGDVAAYAGPVIHWIMEKEIRVEASEKILVNTRHGFAGTADLLFRYGTHGVGVIDFKTRKTTPGEKVRTWDTEPMQLASYAATAWGQDRLYGTANPCLVANIVISTTEPGRFEVVKHKDVMDDFIAFLACCTIWRRLKGYDPRVEG